MAKSEALDVLLLDLIEWIGPESRPYREVMDAWRTSCPRLPVWEEACDRGLVARRLEAGCARVCVTPSGRALLRARRP